MFYLLKTHLVLAIGAIYVGALFSALAAETPDPARNASEREPDAIARGQTLEKATHPIFGQKKKEDKAKTDESQKDDQVKEVKDKSTKEEITNEQKCNEKCKQCEKCKERACQKREKCSCCKERACQKREKCSCQKREKCPQLDALTLKKKLTPEEAAALAAEEKRQALEAAKAKAELEARLRINIRHLNTAGWREAQAEIINAGKSAIPILIEAMTEPSEGESSLRSYSLGGHNKADAGRAPRQRHLAEVCAEMLTTIVSAHSNYKGEIPVADQKAWQEWWTLNAETVIFGR